MQGYIILCTLGIIDNVFVESNNEEENTNGDTNGDTNGGNVAEEMEISDVSPSDPPVDTAPQGM